MKENASASDFGSKITVLRFGGGAATAAAVASSVRMAMILFIL